MANMADAHLVFLDGWDNFQALTPNATIGSVKIGGNFEASSIVAGIDAGTDGLFGNADDTTIMNSYGLSRIASVIIGGSVLGTADTTDHFGIVAANIDSAKIGGKIVPLTVGLDAPVELTPTTTNDVTLREISFPAI